MRRALTGTRRRAGAERPGLWAFRRRTQGARSQPGLRHAADMGNAGSMDSQQTDFKAHNVPLKLPMPEPGELEERFAIVLVSNAAAGRGDPCGAGGADDPAPRVPRARLTPSPLWAPSLASLRLSSCALQGSSDGERSSGRATPPATNPLSGGSGTSQRVCREVQRGCEGKVAGRGGVRDRPLKLFV